MLFLDLDRFKHINDTLGHEAGDQLLQEVATRLKACLRDSDTVARLGGDEFVVLLPELDEETYVATVAQKILSAVARPFVLIGQEFRVTASIGISTYPQDGLDEQTLTKNADIAMYQAKEDGKNNFQFYSEKLNAELARTTHPGVGPAARPGAQRVSAALPGQAGYPQRPDHRHGSAAALAASRSGHRRPDAIHPGRRGNRPDRADRQVGAQDRLPAERGLAEAGPAAT